MATHHPLPTGHILGQRYRIKKKIGAGGIGVVYEAHDLKLEELRAVKVLHPKGALDETERRRFLSEAFLAQRLQHPNIVRVIDVVVDNGQPIAIVMELLQGSDLAQLLRPNRRLSAERTAEVIYSVCCALGYAHAVGIIHRDVKLENIFLHQRKLPSGELVEEVKLIDLGLAKSQSTRTLALTMKGFVMGTPLYMAPEMTLGVSSLVDERADQWAVAVVAYRMLSGRFPFERQPDEDSDYPLLMRIQTQPPVALQSVALNLPDAMYQAITRGLEKKKEDRFPDIDAFSRALQGLPPSIQGLQALLSSKDECVPVLLGEPATRAVRISVPRFNSRERAESAPYASLRIERESSRRRSISLEQRGAVAPKSPVAKTVAPISEDKAPLVKGTTEKAEQKEGDASSVDAADDREEDDDESSKEGGLPLLPSRYPSWAVNGSRSYSAVIVVCLGVAVVINVTSSLTTSWLHQGTSATQNHPAVATMQTDGGLPAQPSALQGPEPPRVLEKITQSEKLVPLSKGVPSVTSTARQTTVAWRTKPRKSLSLNKDQAQSVAARDRPIDLQVAPRAASSAVADSPQSSSRTSAAISSTGGRIIIVD